MAIPILVVTQNAGFGELISQILTESGDYSLSLATGKTDAVASARAARPGLLVLETEFDANPIGEVVDALRAEVPELRLILIAPEGVPEDASYSALGPDRVLVKPIYLPDLVNRVEEVIEQSDVVHVGNGGRKKVTRPTAHNTTVETAAPPEWLSDVNLAAQYLTRLSLESSAQASLISRQDQIWAYAGELPKKAAEALAKTVGAHFENGGGSDLARFVRLEETGSEYMLYATALGGDYVLSTVFDAETPFSKIRSHASSLADALSTPPPVEEVEEVEQPEEEEELLTEQEMDIRSLLEDVPPPIPEDWTPEQPEEEKNASLLEELLESSPTDEFSSETVAVPRAASQARQRAQGVPQESEAETLVSRSRLAPEFDAIPVPDKEMEVEPVSPSMYNLTYACVLIPRFVHHHLTGDAAKRLSEWITHLCVAFGWRLEHLSIRPEYVQWLVNVPPNTSPGYLMRTIREHTSRRMFIEFPIMEQDNPSGDFWAPGYLILGNPSPPPASLVQEFIDNTRSRQGVQE